MCMPVYDMTEITVAVIKNLIILGEHILAGLEFALQIAFHGSPPDNFCGAVLFAFSIIT